MIFLLRHDQSRCTRYSGSSFCSESLQECALWHAYPRRPASFAGQKQSSEIDGDGDRTRLRHSVETTRNPINAWDGNLTAETRVV